MSESEAIRHEFLTETSRDQHAAELVLGGATHVPDAAGFIRLEVTDDQLATARAEMLSGPTTELRHEPEPAKPDRLEIPFLNEAIEIPNQPLCTFEQLLAAKRTIERRYPDLIADLPPDHPWRQAKISHELVVSAGTQDVLMEMAKNMKEENIYLLMLMAGSHDIGRAIQVKKSQLQTLSPETNPQRHHGHYSVDVLREWGVLDQFDPPAREILSYGIEHHADIRTPELPPQPTDLQKIEHVFTCALRDMDKLAIFRSKTRSYLYDPVEKVKQNKVGNFTGEQGRIDPPEILEAFEKQSIIDRKECKSYEAYMLQYLAWIYDLNLRDSLKASVATGAVDTLLGYFAEQLPAEQSERIAKATRDYIASHTQ